jgi:hypothetical protein
MVTQTTQKIYIPKRFEGVLKEFFEWVKNDAEFVSYMKIEAKGLMEKMCSKTNSSMPSEDMIKMLSNSKTCMIRFLIHKYVKEKEIKCQAQMTGQRN